MTLTKLGNPDAAADGVLEAFDVDDADLEIVLDCSEFTCRCPITAQPDWATIEIRYRPGPRVVETKSLKLYLETFREVGIFHEHLATHARRPGRAARAGVAGRDDALQPPRRHRRQRDLELSAG